MEPQMPLLSIVIPTRNRQEYAASCITSLLRVPSPDVEIIVQDNSDSNELSRLLQQRVGDHRLLYALRSGRLSVIDNCNHAIARATGEYVTLLGDDDGVNPEIMEATEWARENKVDALIPFRIAHYNWPDVRYKYYGKKWAGTLTVRRFSGSIVAQDVEAGVRASARWAFQNLVDSVNLPKLYYGIIRRECLEQLFRATGAYFHGVSPDIGVAIGLSRFVGIAYAVDYPLFLPGTSAKSTAGAGVRKEHLGRLEDQPHLPADCARNWPLTVPAFFAVQTVWAQSAVAALLATDRQAVLKEFDVALLHAMCAVFNPRYARSTMRNYYRALRASGRSVLPGTVELVRAVGHTWLLRARILLRRVTRSPSHVPMYTRSGIANIDDAVVALTQYLRDSGRRFPSSARAS
jgi:hypothetical protein